MSIDGLCSCLDGPGYNTAGLPTTLPWGMAIADGVKRHPVALYEIVFLLALALALHFVRVGNVESVMSEEERARGILERAKGILERAKGEGRRAKEDTQLAFQSGDRFRLFLTSYLAFRLAVDFLKPDPPPLLLGLSAIQWACVAGLVYYTVVLFSAERQAFRRLPRRSDAAAG